MNNEVLGKHWEYNKISYWGLSHNYFSNFIKIKVNGRRNNIFTACLSLDIKKILFIKAPREMNSINDSSLTLQATSKHSHFFLNHKSRGNDTKGLSFVHLNNWTQKTSKSQIVAAQIYTNPFFKGKKQGNFVLCFHTHCERETMQWFVALRKYVW